MLVVLLSTLIMLALLDRATRYGRLELLKLQTRFKLFALRDELRRKLISGEIPNSNWFAYMDTTLTKSIDRLNDFTIWEAAALAASVDGDPSVQKAHKNLQQALKRPENREIASIFNKYRNCLMGFLYNRHTTFRFFMNLKKSIFGDRKNNDIPTISREELEREQPVFDPVVSQANSVQSFRDKTGGPRTVQPPTGPRPAHPRTPSFSTVGVLNRMPAEAVSIFSRSPETSTLLKYGVNGERVAV